jgi:hypothetical protein
MSPAWTAVGKHILSLFVKRKSVCKEGPQMAITCNEERRQRWTDRLERQTKRIEEKEGNIFLKKRSGLRIITKN